MIPALLVASLLAAVPPPVAWPAECVRRRSDVPPDYGTQECKDARGRKIAGTITATADDFTGTVHVLNRSGWTERVERYKDGVQDGLQEAFFADGSPARRDTLVAGRHEGTTVVYLSPGEKDREETYEKDCKIGEKLYWPGGKLRREMRWARTTEESLEAEKKALRSVAYYSESGAKEVEETWNEGRLVDRKRFVDGKVVEGPLRVRVLSRTQLTDVLASAMGVLCDGLPSFGGVHFTVAGNKLQIENGRACDLIELRTPEIRSVQPRRAFKGTVQARAKDGIVEFVELAEVEDYVRGVVAAESATDQAAALQAQAVVSRTFALASRGRHLDEGYDLCDLAHCQVYQGFSGSEAARSAAEATAGRVLKRQGRLWPAWFHSSCGGATSPARDVFGEGAAGEGVGDLDEQGKPLCAGSPDAAWTFTLERGALARALGLPAQGRALEVARKDRAGRIVEVRAFGAKLSGDELQSRVGRAVGWNKLKSLLAEVDEQDGVVRFRGRGLGHGVGMCQWGAAALAKKGWSYQKILGKYFPGATVE